MTVVASTILVQPPFLSTARDLVPLHRDDGPIAAAGSAVTAVLPALVWRPRSAAVRIGPGRG